MNINKDLSTYVLPYKVIILDATDAYYYADVMGIAEEAETTDNLEIAKELANAHFVLKNYKWDSLEEMNSCDGGYDVRVYDSKYSCVYAAHEKFKETWIGEATTKRLTKLQRKLVDALQEAKEQGEEQK